MRRGERGRVKGKKSGRRGGNRETKRRRNERERSGGERRSRHSLPFLSPLLLLLSTFAFLLLPFLPLILFLVHEQICGGLNVKV